MPNSSATTDTMRPGLAASLKTWMQDTRDAKMRQGDAEQKQNVETAVNRAANKNKWSGPEKSQVAAQYH